MSPTDMQGQMEAWLNGSYDDDFFDWTTCGVQPWMGPTVAKAAARVRKFAEEQFRARQEVMRIAIVIASAPDDERKRFVTEWKQRREEEAARYARGREQADWLRGAVQARG